MGNNSQHASAGAPNGLIPSLFQSTRKLISLTYKEINLLDENDVRGFAELQEEKAKYIEEYAAYCRAFQDQINAFAKTDPDMLDKLEDLQAELGALSMQSKDMVSDKFRTSSAASSSAYQNTQATLLSAQEIGQDAPAPTPQNYKRKP